METIQRDQDLMTFTLSVDEPHLSSIRSGVEITFRAGDQMIVSLTKNPKPGSLVLIAYEKHNRLCRFENIHGNDYLFPPTGVDPSFYKEILIGQVIEHVRISK